MISRILIFLFLAVSLQAKISSIWLPIWEIISVEKIDAAFANIAAHNFDEVLVQVRYRGDAAYIPNKFNDFYPNSEGRYHAIKDSLFDPLEYVIDAARKLDIEVHAWVPAFVITGHELEKLQPDNPYFTKPEWITVDRDGKKMDYKDHQGAFLDPGISQVQDYTQNVILDIISNYDVDGIHLDYIRYPDSYFGHNILAKNEYRKAVKEDNLENWQTWKEDQINGFVGKIYTQIKQTAPMVKVSAAVFADLNTAVGRYSQNWINWLEADMIDRVYLMAYSKSTSTIESQLNFISVFEKNEKIIVGLRAWSTEFTYPVEKINEKIELVCKTNFAGYALFSYTGIMSSHYFPKLELGIQD